MRSHTRSRAVTTYCLSQPCTGVKPWFGEQPIDYGLSQRTPTHTPRSEMCGIASSHGGDSESLSSSLAKYGADKRPCRQHLLLAALWVFKRSESLLPRIDYKRLVLEEARHWGVQHCLHKPTSIRGDPSDQACRWGRHFGIMRHDTLTRGLSHHVDLITLLP